MKHQFINKTTGRVGSVMVITFDVEDDNRIQNYSYEYVEDLMEEWAAYEPYETEANEPVSASNDVVKDVAFIEHALKKWTSDLEKQKTENENIESRRVVDLRPQWKEITIQIDALNKLISESILHGGDGGGAYLTNREGLEKAIDDYLDTIGMKALVDVYWKDEDDPLLVVNDGCCHCPGCMRNYMEAKDEK